MLRMKAVFGMAAWAQVARTRDSPATHKVVAMSRRWQLLLLLIIVTAATTALIRRDDHITSVTLPINVQQDLPLRLRAQTIEVRHRVNRLAIDALNHVALLQLLGRRAVRINIGDHDSPHVGWQAKLVADGGGQVLDGNAPQRSFLN